MKKRLKLVIKCFILSLLQISCSSDNSKGTIKHNFSDGSGYSISQYYIKNGDTIINGQFSVYDNQNILRKQGTYVNNEIYGKTKFYYENGNVKSIHFIEKNKDIGEVSWYYPNGKIEKYTFYDDLGNLNFSADYDERGVLKKCDGIILFEIYQFKIREKNRQKNYNIGDKVKYQFMFPNIPNTQRRFHFELIGYDNSKIKRVVKKIEPVILDVEEQTVKKGKNTIKAYIQYKFKDERQIVLSDTISFDFYVE